VSRSVRDSAAALDAISGFRPGDPYAAAPPVRPFATEVGANPGALRIGVLSRRAPAGLVEVDGACTAAADDAAELLSEVGRDTVVDAAYPEPLDDIELLVHHHRARRQHRVRPAAAGDGRREPGPTTSSRS
jgi:amidase